MRDSFGTPPLRGNVAVPEGHGYFSQEVGPAPLVADAVVMRFSCRDTRENDRVVQTGRAVSQMPSVTCCACGTRSGSSNDSPPRSRIVKDVRRETLLSTSHAEHGC